MALQNRVDPFGELIADPSRGLFLGNRGGRIHRDDRTLTRKRYASRRWICCLLNFKGRHRDVWGRGYTELFFLDEPTSLAAGHRPCFECRRRDAQAFAAAFPGSSRSAADMDRILHAERLDGLDHVHDFGSKRPTLPDGTFIRSRGAALALYAGRFLRWMPSGYEPVHDIPGDDVVDVLTPPSIVAVLAAGYCPRWHPSAERCLT